MGPAYKEYWKFLNFSQGFSFESLGCASLFPETGNNGDKAISRGAYNERQVILPILHKKHLEPQEAL